VALSIPRPVPIGMTRSGVPKWDGADLRRFRIAHGIPEGHVARSMSTSTRTITEAYEQTRQPVAHSYDRAEKYFQSVERLAATRDTRAADALAELRQRVPKVARRAATMNRAGASAPSSPPVSTPDSTAI
jgi:hypothetical protein